MQQAPLANYPICRALIRPNLLMGMQYMPAIFLITTCAALVVTWVLPVMAVGGVLFLFGMAGLRMMAKADPEMIAVYFNHLRYKRWHPPHQHVED